MYSKQGSISQGYPFFCVSGTDTIFGQRKRIKKSITHFFSPFAISSFEFFVSCWEKRRDRKAMFPPLNSFIFLPREKESETYRSTDTTSHLSCWNNNIPTSLSLVSSIPLLSSSFFDPFFLSILLQKVAVRVLLSCFERESPTDHDSLMYLFLFAFSFQSEGSSLTPKQTRNT